MSPIQTIFAVGQPVKITTDKSPDSTLVPITARIIEISEQTLLISIPYQAGRIVVWPIGTTLQVNFQQNHQRCQFESKVLHVEWTDIPCYMIHLPQEITSLHTISTPLPATSGSRMIAITSGKGGVGKTTFSINLAIALAAKGKRVFIIDGDLGTANVDVLLGLQVSHNITHLLRGEKNILEIAVPGPGNIVIIPGGSGLQELTSLNERQFNHVISSFNHLDGLADFILLDTGAGISKEVSNFLVASDEVIIISTPEPHAITDAYAITKVMHKAKCSAKKMLVINRAETEREGHEVFTKLSRVAKEYLSVDLEYLGHIVDDRAVSKSLRQQTPLMLISPHSSPAQNIDCIAAKLLQQPIPKASGLTNFIWKMKNLFSPK